MAAPSNVETNGNGNADGLDIPAELQRAPDPPAIDVIDEKAWLAKLQSVFAECEDIDAVKQKYASMVRPQNDRVSIETWIAAEKIACDAISRVAGNFLTT
jgi:hypothetical protein